MLARRAVIEPETAQDRKNSLRNLVGRSGILARRYPTEEVMLVRLLVIAVD